jgi:hypothetical protein
MKVPSHLTSVVQKNNGLRGLTVQAAGARECPADEKMVAAFAY